MLNGIAGAATAQKTQYELPRGADAFRLSAGQLQLELNTQKASFLTFILPAPERVVALRSRQVEIIDAFGNRRSAVMPTTYAFVYRVTDPTALSLNPDTGWKPQSSTAPSRFANLVVAAGLPLDGQDPTGQHVHAAFAEVRSYFPGLSLEVLSTGAEVQSRTVEGFFPDRRSQNLSRSRTPTIIHTALTQQTPSPRIVRTSSVLDCQAGGVIVTHP